MTLYTFIFEYDKFRHFLISLLLFLIIFYIRKYKIKNRWFLKTAFYTIRDVFVIWLLKEFVDLFGFWNPEIKDLLADSIWIIFPIYIYYLFKEKNKINNSFLKYERLSINKLEKNIFSTLKKLSLIIRKIYKISFFEKIVYLSIKELFYTFMFFTLYTFVLALNIFIFCFEIPFLALIDTSKILFKSISFWFNKLY